jgi:plasmid stabilization system protein ParE
MQGTQPRRVVISAEARLDIDDILSFGLPTFGYTQSEKYGLHLSKAFSLLADYTHMGKARPDLQAFIRCQPMAAHLIFYVGSDERVMIARVLHRSVDVTAEMFENLQ